MMWPYYYNGYDGYGMHDYGFYSFSMLIFWILIIIGIIFIVRSARYGKNRGGWYKDEKGPIDILKERYAKGEITKEQFEQMKKDLE